MYIHEKTLDDLLNKVFKKLLASKTHVIPTRGANSEITGVILEVANPRARLSRTEKKGKLFSSLGELLWYLSGTNKLDFIGYYLGDYGKFSDDGKTIHGGYGPRLFDQRGNDQIGNIISLLKRKPTSRQAVIQLFDASDLAKKYKDIPCTCTLQFMIRDGKLNILTSMRSNDAFLGLPHDVFAFTMLQEILARSLGVELGSYKHVVGSLHLYDQDRENAKQYIKEGYQQIVPMPPFPEGEPWEAIKKVLEAEEKIRTGRKFEIKTEPLEPFWKDIISLLQIFGAIKKKNPSAIAGFKKNLSTNIYNTYIDRRQTNLATLEKLRKTSDIAIVV